jgi:hypothetical protein
MEVIPKSASKILLIFEMILLEAGTAFGTFVTSFRISEQKAR